MALRWIAPRFGGPEVLALVEFDVAAPGPGEVTIDVRAAGVNPADYKHLAVARGPGRPLPLPPPGRQDRPDPVSGRPLPAAVRAGSAQSECGPTRHRPCLVSIW